ncbi:MAG TPA: hypothetical protein VMZ27_06220 [Candidatus Saccharimonadales bacterium]|nr:hypothetical protein [Candidatus Saccharimonadales bacterium]
MNIEQKNKFIELRVKGDSLGSISQALGIPKTTLWRWEKEEKAHINELQLADQEEFEHQWKEERESFLANIHDTIDGLHCALIEKLDKDRKYMSVKELFLYLNLLRSEMCHYRIQPLTSEIPAPGQGTNNPQPAKVEQNGTISLQNGTMERSITPANSVTTDLSSKTRCVAEQNGTISPQNGTAHT